MNAALFKFPPQKTWRFDTKQDKTIRSRVSVVPLKKISYYVVVFTFNISTVLKTQSICMLFIQDIVSEKTCHENQLFEIEKFKPPPRPPHLAATLNL